MAKSGIYCWTNLINGKKYIGKSVDLAGRKTEFLNFHYHYGGQLINNARRKYDSMEFWDYEVLEYCSIKDLNEREIYYIAVHNSTDRNQGYNLTKGGDGVVGFHHTDETKRRLSIAGRNHSAESIERCRAKLLGKKQSEETKRKRSESNKGRLVSDETRKKISIANAGRKPSNQTLALAREKNIKPVHQIDPKSGEIIKTYQSITDACVCLGGLFKIGDCCKGKRKTAGGYKWMFAEKELINNYLL